MPYHALTNYNIMLYIIFTPYKLVCLTKINMFLGLHLNQSDFHSCTDVSHN